MVYGTLEMAICRVCSPATKLPGDGHLRLWGKEETSTGSSKEPLGPVQRQLAAETLTGVDTFTLISTPASAVRCSLVGWKAVIWGQVVKLVDPNGAVVLHREFFSAH